jgi:flagellar FliL protein
LVPFFDWHIPCSDLCGGGCLLADQAEESTAEPKAEGDGDPVQKKGEPIAKVEPPSTKLVMMLLAVNIVAMIAFAFLAWRGASKRAHEASLSDIKVEEGSSHEAKTEGGEHGGGEKGKEGDGAKDLFIKESFTANLRDTANRRFAKVDVEIEVPDDFVREDVNRIRPKIRDFILVVLSSKTYEEIESLDGRNFLREEIKNKINGYLTRGQIKNVYFTQFIIQ